MQIEWVFIFLILWLLVCWLGSVALEATGMQRKKARFQALSALTGTGFTTSEAESVVNHPSRRIIISLLIFVGNTGIIAALVLLVFTLAAAVKAQEFMKIGILLAIGILAVLFIVTGIMNRLTSRIVSSIHKGKKNKTRLVAVDEVLYESGSFGIVRFRVSEDAVGASHTLQSVGIGDPAIRIIAIERSGSAIPSPSITEHLQADDGLLCYGELSRLNPAAW